MFAICDDIFNNFIHADYYLYLDFYSSYKIFGYKIPSICFSLHFTIIVSFVFLFGS